MSEDVSTSNKAVWEAESTHPELAAALKQELRRVVDPEIGLDIIALGLVRDVHIEEDKAEIKMVLTTPFCPYGPAMLEATRQTAETFLGRPTTIEMLAEMWDYSYMEEGAGDDWGLW